MAVEKKARELKDKKWGKQAGRGKGVETHTEGAKRQARDSVRGSVSGAVSARSSVPLCLLCAR